MPKRACPYEEDLLPQIKIHVGQKQVDNGVASDKRLKNVYDKTLNLLKAGAKALSHKSRKSTQMDLTDLPLPPLPPSSCKLKSISNLKQMQLTNKLQLMASDKIISDIQVDTCGYCRVIDQSTVNRCYYCDQILCASCLSACVRCSELFCQNCSLFIYNQEEQKMCLNCHR
ncbi:PREDICTED: apoptosis regulatory protein Siva-like [Dinoponera quadriceps]|uniref:Apoptosis regulatory protein Siva-like n=1 Tax=Dinoponera quadriceps TaxID=609295 RepID=A0A6P3WNS0_DINQU|nr:PREDICTED: apoptosis regulatory protein Siva-like [Dinoponera quadriceps]